MKKTDRERLKKIILTWEKMQKQIKDHKITEYELMFDEYSQWAITTPLYNIGEQVYYLSNTIKERYPELPWDKVTGLRHRLVHDYDGINWSIIVEIVFKDMNVFVTSVKQILNEMQDDL